MRKLDLLIACGLAGLGVACLEPPEEEVPAETYFEKTSLDALSPELDIENARPPGFDPDLLATDVAYLKGYAGGHPVRYWNVDGANTDLIVPAYRIVKPNGIQVGAMIIDALPGEAGYSPWWRIYEATTTTAYQDEVIGSRDGIDAAVRAGLLTEPTATAEVINAPVATDAVVTSTQTGGGDGPNQWHKEAIWYRGMRAHWLRFPDVFETKTRGDRKMPVYPVYILQRINEAFPLYEFATSVDVDGDERLDNSNNVFAADIPEEGYETMDIEYSPLWAAYLVRVTADYPSIDSTTSATVGIASKAQILDEDGAMQPYVHSISDKPIMEFVNCPIQRREAP